MRKSYAYKAMRESEEIGPTLADLDRFNKHDEQWRQELAYYTDNSSLSESQLEDFLRIDIDENIPSEDAGYFVRDINKYFNGNFANIESIEYLENKKWCPVLGLKEVEDEFQFRFEGVTKYSFRNGNVRYIGWGGLDSIDVTDYFLSHQENTDLVGYVLKDNNDNIITPTVNEDVVMLDTVQFLNKEDAIAYAESHPEVYIVAEVYGSDLSYTSEIAWSKIWQLPSMSIKENKMKSKKKSFKLKENYVTPEQREEALAKARAIHNALMDAGLQDIDMQLERFISNQPNEKAWYYALVNGTAENFVDERTDEDWKQYLTESKKLKEGVKNQISSELNTLEMNVNLLIDSNRYYCPNDEDLEGIISAVQSSFTYLKDCCNFLVEDAKGKSNSLKESVILHFDLEDGIHKAIPFDSEEEALEYLDSDDFPIGEWVGSYRIETVKSATTKPSGDDYDYKVLEPEDVEKLDRLVKEIKDQNEDGWCDWISCAIEIGRKYLGESLARYGEGEYTPFEDLINECETFVYYKTINIDKLLDKRLAFQNKEDQLEESKMLEDKNFVAVKVLDSSDDEAKSVLESYGGQLDYEVWSISKENIQDVKDEIADWKNRIEFYASYNNRSGRFGKKFTESVVKWTNEAGEATAYELNEQVKKTLRIYGYDFGGNESERPGCVPKHYYNRDKAFEGQTVYLCSVKGEFYDEVIIQVCDSKVCGMANYTIRSPEGVLWMGQTPKEFVEDIQDMTSGYNEF